ncbi:MAG TPA: hypothetical protein DDW52_07745 [Planctomycetaceae bacterium]|nr:hypothetical protein [Planctomycetaceae bacterium]
MGSLNSSSTTKPRRLRKALPVWVQGMVLLVVFASGIGVGAVGASRYVLTRMQHYRAHPEVLPAEITDTLTSRLGLTDDQSKAVLAVITKRHGRIEEVRQSSSPEIHEEFDLLEEEVAELLNDPQKQRWLATADWVRKSFLPLNPDSVEIPE